jgi:tetratricopeptide (TPR) repeat protein
MLAVMRVRLSICAFLLTLPCVAQSRLENQWTKLLDQKRYSQATQLCTSWTHAKRVDTQVEAQKCLANLALVKGKQTTVIGHSESGGDLVGDYTPAAIEDALKHMDEGIRLAPHDPSLYTGRLDILELSGRFGDMAKAVDESISMIGGAGALEDWLPYIHELAKMGQFQAGLELCEVLDKHYPNRHEVIGDIGAFYNAMKQTDTSISYLERAVALAPNDAMDNWNLGRAYDFSGQDDLAETYYSKSIALDPAGKDMPERNCIYAYFVEKKLHDKDRACMLQRAACEVEHQTACAVTPPPSAAAMPGTAHP